MVKAEAGRRFGWETRLVNASLLGFWLGGAVVERIVDLLF